MVGNHATAATDAYLCMMTMLLLMPTILLDLGILKCHNSQIISHLESCRIFSIHPTHPYRSPAEISFSEWILQSLGIMSLYIPHIALELLPFAKIGLLP